MVQFDPKVSVTYPPLRSATPFGHRPDSTSQLGQVEQNIAEASRLTKE